MIGFEVKVMERLLVPCGLSWRPASQRRAFPKWTVVSIYIHNTNV